MKKYLFYFIAVFVLSTNYAFSNHERLLLITGCGRSGTHYTAKLLKLAGLDLPHERLGNHGSVSWFRGGGRYYIYGKRINKVAGNETFRHIFHQVRHPLKNIASAQTFEKTSWEYVYGIIKQIQPSDPLIVRCAKYWYYWNSMVEKKAEWTYCVEDFDEIFDEMALRLGLILDRTSLSKIAKGTDTRQKKYKPITWDELQKAIDPTLYQNIIKLAAKYGYETPLPV